jgi:hypothetical protein
VSNKEEMRIGDRLLPEPTRELVSYVPHAPGTPVAGQIVSIYGSAVANAAENQVVVINRGAADGLERGHVMAILKDGERLADKTDSARPQIKLPNERNGLMMVFRTFDKLSYALILQATDGVKVGDRFVNPNVQGNLGGLTAWPEPLHGLPASADLTIPANSVLIFARQP